MMDHRSVFVEILRRSPMVVVGRMRRDAVSADRFGCHVSTLGCEDHDGTLEGIVRAYWRALMQHTELAKKESE